jgi:succinate dehydrogenase (ubiquinone) cytochrome b560 subunit
MASSLIRFSKVPFIATGRSIDTLTNKRRQLADCISRASLWRVQRPTSSTPASYATIRFLTRPISTGPKHESPPRQVKTHSNRLQTQPTSLTTPNQTRNPPPHHLLAAQRLSRPVAPHLSIYRRQITSVLSVLQRLTGLTLSAAFSLFPILHLSSTHLGLDFDLSAEATAASFGCLPWIVKSAVKFGVAWIFIFHGLNSLRFLAWKFARGVTNREVAVSGWVVVVGSVAGAAGFVWFV